MKISPFKYGTTVSSSSFTNREKEIQKVYRNLTEGINTIIISPRRWGKSSLVEKVVCKIKANNSDKRTIVLDLFAVGSQEEFLEIFAKEILKASATKLEDLMENVKTFFKQIIPTVSFGIDPTQDFSLRFNVEELKKYQDEILNLPEVIAQKKGIQFIICLDEFQNLAVFKIMKSLKKKCVQFGNVKKMLLTVCTEAKGILCRKFSIILQSLFIVSAIFCFCRR